MKMLSMQRPLPSIEIRVPTRFSLSVQTKDVNWPRLTPVQESSRDLALVDLSVSPHDDAKDFARDVSFQATNCFELRVSGRDASGHVILRASIQSQSRDCDNVDCAVRRAITTSVQPVANRLPGRRRDRVGPPQRQRYIEGPEGTLLPQRSNGRSYMRRARQGHR